MVEYNLHHANKKKKATHRVASQTHQLSQLKHTRATSPPRPLSQDLTPHTSHLTLSHHTSHNHITHHKITHMQMNPLHSTNYPHHTPWSKPTHNNNDKDPSSFISFFQYQQGISRVSSNPSPSRRATGYKRERERERSEHDRQAERVHTQHKKGLRERKSPGTISRKPTTD